MLRKFICFFIGHDIVYYYRCNLGNSVLISNENGIEKREVIGITTEKCKRCEINV